MVPYNTALGGTLPSGAFGGNIVILQLNRTYELWQSSLARSINAVYSGRTARFLDTSTWDMGLSSNMQTRVMHMSDDSLVACNVSDIHSAGWNASSRVARERCVGPDMLRGTWNSTSQQVAKTITALPGVSVCVCVGGVVGVLMWICVDVWVCKCVGMCVYV